MKHVKLATLLALPLSLCAVGITLAAQDRWSLVTPNRISFSEFKGYEAWKLVASSLPDDATGCGTSKEPGCIKTVLGNPALIKAYGEGIPANGKPVPDGAVLVKIEWAKARNPQSPYAVFVPGPLAEVAFMMKDSKRFPKTNGWGYATFRYETKTDAWKPYGDNAEFASTCHGCHTIAKVRDYVFTSHPKR